MKLTKRQREKLYDYHIGVGFVAFKSGIDELETFEFYIDGEDKIRSLTDNINSPEVDINKEILSKCVFKSE